MKIPNIFTKIANSKWGQKVYSKVLNPKNENFLNYTTPVIESGLISCFYMASTAVQKDIDKDSKTALQWQNALSGVVSVGMAIPMNRGIAKFADNVSKNLKPELVQDCHKVSSGLRVGLPIISSLLISRFLVAVALVPLSSKIRDCVKEYRSKDRDGLNILA